jgi:hypothetical protein
MARTAAAPSIDAIIRDAVAAVVERAVSSIQNAISAQVAAELKAAAPRSSGRVKGTVPARRRARRAEMTKWVADRNARRVPNFVIELTKLDTKKAIVARYGENAAFEKGRPLPSVKAEAAKSTAREAKPAAVKAKAPVVRKKAAATGAK